MRRVHGGNAGGSFRFVLQAPDRSTTTSIRRRCGDDIRALHDDEDHAWALRTISPYSDREPEPGSPEADRFEGLAVLIEACEATRHGIPRADPVEILHVAIKDLGRSRGDLSRILGSRVQAAEILDRRRPLTLDMIRAVASAWRLPLDVLAQPYDLVRDTA